MARSHDTETVRDDRNRREDRTARERLRRAFLTGTALLIPLVLTLVVLQIALDLVSQAVSPIVAGFELVVGRDEAPELVLEVVTVATLAALVLLVGFVAEYRSGPGWLAGEFDALMARIPGLGSVYTGTRRMSEVLLEPDTQAFREVKLVEFPRDGTYVLGFLTAEPPEAIRDAVGTEEMQTLFLPLAPNPVMGGFLVHLPTERIVDVDLSVEEGVQSIVTSGAAVDPRAEDVDALDGAARGDAPLFDGDVLESDVFDAGVLDADLPGRRDQTE